MSLLKVVQFMIYGSTVNEKKGRP